MSFLSRLFGSTGASNQRLTGKPTSSNGASSMHLFWDVPPVPLRSVSVTLTVDQRPSVPDLYFWALQASFVEGATTFGAAHLGLQHHTDYPDACAVNWGGYHSAESPDGSGELQGTQSHLPTTTGNVNTRCFTWQPGQPYRLAIEHGDSGWAGVVTDLQTGSPVTVRELHVRGSALRLPMVWAEVFAACDAGPVRAVWSDPVVVTAVGDVVAVQSARVNYQAESDGGCSNSSVEPAPNGIAQTTSTPRALPKGSMVPFNRD